MSRKDFTAIAAAINNSVVQVTNTFAGDQYSDQLAGALDGIHTAAVQIANACADANPRFNRNLFLTACGVTGGAS